MKTTKIYVTENWVTIGGAVVWITDHINNDTAEIKVVKNPQTGKFVVQLVDHIITEEHDAVHNLQTGKVDELPANSTIA